MKIFLFFILSFFSFSCKDYDFKNIKVYNIYNDKVFHYLEEDELKDVDINTFEILSGRLSSCEYASYAKDKSHVYFRNMLIKDVDVETFEIIDSNYSKDKNHIYFRGEVLKKANVKLKTEAYRGSRCWQWSDTVCLINGNKKFYKDKVVKDFFKLK